MSHSCSRPVCSPVCTLAIHSPHHLPIPLTFIRSSPSNRSDWLVFHACRFSLRESRRAAHLNNALSQVTLFCLCVCVCFPDVPRNFSVNLATKTSVLLTWEFPESSNPYRFTVCPSASTRVTFCKICKDTFVSAVRCMIFVVLWRILRKICYNNKHFLCRTKFANPHHHVVLVLM